MKSSNNAVNCRNCKHFVITWNPNAPYGCKAFDFRSKKLPSAEVFAASGKSCLKYEVKQVKV